MSMSRNLIRRRYLPCGGLSWCRSFPSGNEWHGSKRSYFSSFPRRKNQCSKFLYKDYIHALSSRAALRPDVAKEVYRVGSVLLGTATARVTGKRRVTPQQGTACQPRKKVSRGNPATET